MFGHFIEEGVGLKTVEIKDGEGIDPVFDGRGEEDSFVGDVLLDLVEIVFELVRIVVVIILNFYCLYWEYSHKQ